MEKRTKEMKEYIAYLKKQADKFRLTHTDLTNLFDLLMIADTPSEIDMDIKETIKLNKLDKWFYEFKNKIENIVLRDK